jgi:hypothetical protein
MSGYLHRLVHAVSHPRETLHPRTGSLFAPYRSEPDSPSEWFEQAETVETYPARSEPFTIGEPAETVQHPARSNHSQSAQRPGTADEPPRISETVRRSDVSPPTASKARLDAVEQAVQLPRRLVARQAQHDVPESRGDAGVQSYVPLLLPQRSEAHGTRPETPRFSAEAPSIREARKNLTAEGRLTRAEREPDEIQIHIGRIEVTAVQPSAPRAPTPPDKAISLDAYLERRNGRAR